MSVCQFSTWPHVCLPVQYLAPCLSASSVLGPMSVCQFSTWPHVCLPVQYLAPCLSASSVLGPMSVCQFSTWPHICLPVQYLAPCLSASSVLGAPCLSASSVLGPMSVCQFYYHLQCFYFTHQVNLFFEDNIADVGSAVYANYLDFCSWYTSVEPYFDNKKAYRWNTIEFG